MTIFKLSNFKHYWDRRIVQIEIIVVEICFRYKNSDFRKSGMIKETNYIGSII